MQLNWRWACATEFENGSDRVINSFIVYILCVEYLNYIILQHIYIWTAIALILE